MSCYNTLLGLLNEGDIFVETGTGKGRGVKHALTKNVKEVHSVEIDVNRYNLCVKRLKQYKNVYLYNGDSIKMLPHILDNHIRSKTVFLLDAHVMDLKETSGAQICPVLEELKLILDNGKVNNVKHIIVIDDVKLFDGSRIYFGNIKLDTIKQLILSYDAAYEIKVDRRALSAI